MIYSDEQLMITKELQNNNIVVDSCAGAGKSTSISLVSSTFKDKRILVLTYSNRLKQESSEKLKKFKNTSVYTFHGFSNKFYGPCLNDNQLKDNLTKFAIDKINFNILILDEVQDANNLLVKLVHKINKDNIRPFERVLILGDVFQSIYNFKGSDGRYITYSDKIFNLNSQSWVKLNLSCSYRITNQIKDFVNSCIGHDRIKSAPKVGNKINYNICNPYDKDICSKILNYIKSGYKPDEIAVLGFSLKNAKSPIKVLENRLCQCNVPVYYASDDNILDMDVMTGKVVFSTFHQFKGLERKVIFVFGFDDFMRDESQTFCSNIWYVVLTRSLEILEIFHSESNPFLPFVDVDKIYSLCNVVGSLKIKNSPYEERNDKPQMAVTQFIKFLPFELLDKITTFLNIKRIKEPSNHLTNIPDKIRVEVNDQVLYENVNYITGIAIPLYFDIKKRGVKSDIISLLNNEADYNRQTHLWTVNMKDYTTISPLGLRIPEILGSTCHDFITLYEDDISAEKLLLITNIYISFKDTLLNSIKQIETYDWISTKDLNFLYSRMLNIVGNGEVAIEKYIYNDKLRGYVDCIDYNNLIVWEFKYTNKLTIDHIIQLAMYMYLLYEMDQAFKDFKFVLFNIKTGECLQITSTENDLDIIVQDILNYKNIGAQKVSDEQFLNSFI
jgi:hypothetical protein